MFEFFSSIVLVNPCNLRIDAGCCAAPVGFSLRCHVSSPTCTRRCNPQTIRVRARPRQPSTRRLTVSLPNRNPNDFELHTGAERILLQLRLRMTGEAKPHTTLSASIASARNLRGRRNAPPLKRACSHPLASRVPGWTAGRRSSILWANGSTSRLWPNPWVFSPAAPTPTMQSARG